MIINGFTDLFSIHNWNFKVTTGVILTHKFPTTLLIVSGDHGYAGKAIMTIPIIYDGIITFSYSSKAKNPDLSLDPFGYIFNSLNIILNSDSCKNRTITINVKKGDVFGFFVETLANKFVTKSIIINTTTIVVDNFIYKTENPS